MRDVDEFLERIVNEGGVVAALEYDLRAESHDLPEDMAASWVALKVKYAEFQILADAWWAEFGEGYDL